MTTQSLCNQIKIANNETLKLAYETCCEEYRKRLCEQWEIWVDSTSWDKPFMQGLLYIDFIGGIVLDINQVRMVVENDIKLNDFLKWWDYGSKNKFCPTMENWFLKGIRPEDYENNSKG